MVLSTSESPSISLGSRIVTLSDPIDTCTSIVWLKSRGVRSSIGDWPWGTFPTGTMAPLSVALFAPYSPSSSTLSLLLAFFAILGSCCNLDASPPHVPIFLKSSHCLYHSFQLVSCLVQVFHCLILLYFFFSLALFGDTAAFGYELDEAALLPMSL